MVSDRDDERAAGVAAAEDGQADILSLAEVGAVLGEHKRCPGTAGVAEFVDIVEKAVVGQLKLVGHIGHDALVGLMAYDAVEFVCAYASGHFAGVVEGVDHVFACVYEHILAERHCDAVFFRAKLDTLRAFRHVAESACIDGADLRLSFRTRFGRQEICHCRISPEMSAFLVALVGVISVVLRAYEQCAAGLACGEIPLDYLQTVLTR